jgi:hypothetical protein
MPTVTFLDPEDTPVDLVCVAVCDGWEDEAQAPDHALHWLTSVQECFEMRAWAEAYSAAESLLAQLSRLAGHEGETFICRRA